MEGRGTTKGSVHPELVAVLDQLAADAGELARSALAPGARVWQVPPSRSQPVGVLDIAGIGSLFDRSAIGQNYADTLSDADAPGTTGDTQSLRLQNERLAMEERAYRLRHCSPIRSAVHAAARRAGHADPAGVFGAASRGHLENLIRGGAV